MISLLAYDPNTRKLFVRDDLRSPWRQVKNNLNGIFDNKRELRREAWLDGGKVGQWTNKVCGLRDYIDNAARGWEKSALEHPFGHHPDLPHPDDAGCTGTAPDEKRAGR